MNMQSHQSTLAMEAEMKTLSEAAALFEVNMPEFKQLKACRIEIKMLKNLWDLITLVQSSFADWKTTLWSDINVENMELECKKFVKDIRGLDKEMRAWDAFSGMESSVKNMVTSLRAVGELQNQAIRDRHWEQLMQATQVTQLQI
jgi:dynein heavy chain